MKHTSEINISKRALSALKEITAARHEEDHSERGSTVLEYVLGIALLFPVALGIGLSLEKVSQARGEVALEASQYLLPCTSTNSPLGETDPNECK